MRYGRLADYLAGMPTEDAAQQFGHASSPGEGRGARRTIAVAIGVAAALGACWAPAAAHATARSLAPARSCAKLTGHRLKTGTKVKVVVKRNEAEGIAYACLPPNGRVRKAGQASSETEDGNFSISIAAASGNWVALDLFNGVGIAATEAGKAFNAATGKSFGYWSSVLGPGGLEEAPTKSVRRAQINSFGQLALAASEEKQGTTTNTLIYGVAAAGERRLLDSGPSTQIPTGSLSLSGQTVQWLNAGAVRTATL
jgi:hypothetical protein